MHRHINSLLCPPISGSVASFRVQQTHFVSFFLTGRKGTPQDAQALFFPGSYVVYETQREK